MLGLKFILMHFEVKNFAVCAKIQYCVKACNLDWNTNKLPIDLNIYTRLSILKY